MGFTRPCTIYKLVFDDHPTLNGLVIKVRRGSMRERIEFDKVAALGSVDASAQIKIIATLLDEWNLEDDDGNVLPLTAESLWSLEGPDLKAVLQAWYDAANVVPGPLGQPSPSGDPSLEESMPMETPSPSLAS